jgi:hypothetical protein
MHISYLSEARLPYEFSPNNYDNSASNYDNSVSNYDNSPSNYDNSESNYDNSSSNYDNGRSGSRRLILNENSSLVFAGYYVMSPGGVVNFFSPSGRRMFYAPKNGTAVFGGRSGAFCGVLARVEGRLRLVLTERGMRVLELSD